MQFNSKPNVRIKLIREVLDVNKIPVPKDTILDYITCQGGCHTENHVVCFIDEKFVTYSFYQRDLTNNYDPV